MTLNNRTKFTQNHVIPSLTPGKSAVMKWMFKYYLNMRSICPPFCCTTASRRRRHSPMLLSKNDWHSFSNALTTAFWVRRLRRNFDGGTCRPSAAGHPTRRNQPDLSPELAATCLTQRTGCSHAACNIACFFLAVCIGEWRRRLDAVVAYSRMAAYWAHVQIIFKHWFHDEIRPGITI